MVVDKGHRHLAPARVGVAVQAIAPVADAEAVVVGLVHPAVDPLAGVASDEVEAQARAAVVVAQVGELLLEHRQVLRVAGVEVGIAANKAVAVVAVVGIVAGISTIVAPQPLACRQVDFLVRIAAVHVVGYHIEDRLDPGTVQRAGGLLELAVAAVADVLVEVVPEVALAAARGAVAGVAPAGEVTPGYRHPDGAEAVRGDAWSHAGKGAVPVVGGGAHDNWYSTLASM